MKVVRATAGAGLAAAIALAGPAMAGPAMAAAEDEPLPVDDLSRFESATAISGLSVVVERGEQRLRPKRATTYLISVLNRGEKTETVTVRVSVPPGMSDVVPDDAGELVDGYVDWPVTLAPDTPATLRLTGAYATPAGQSEQTAPTRVALTACALDEEEQRPIVCATDIAELGSRSAAVRWWWAGIAAVVLLAAAGAAVLWWRRRSAGASASTGTAAAGG